LIDGVTPGPVLLRWNGLLIALGIAFGALAAAIEAHRRFQDAELIYYLFVPVTVWAWIGSRLWHVLTPPLSSVQLGLTTSHYLSHPLDILSFWIGGFGIPGAILGGTFALWRASRKDEFSFWEMADVLAPGVLLAQAIGRLGNYFNQELYGLPSHLPWSIFIQPENRLPGYEQIEFYHPLFAYEYLLNLVGVFLLVWLPRSKFAENLKAGDIYLVYLAYYSLIRFLLEILRLDVALVNGVNANQVFFALLFIVAASILGHRRLAPVL
ncbi:MAG: prolipoprotein diacylglyceryl transferase, partial [Chloroflexi bacterium]|nr:prolipoprotein diacylglyceryl transferase [Chloroflexota bacterium]